MLLYVCTAVGKLSLVYCDVQVDITFYSLKCFAKTSAYFDDDDGDDGDSDGIRKKQKYEAFFSRHLISSYLASFCLYHKFV